MKKLIITVLALVVLSFALMAESNKIDPDTASYTFVYSSSGDSYIVINGQNFDLNEGEALYESGSGTGGSDKKWVSTTYHYSSDGTTIDVYCKGSGTGCNAEKEKAQREALF